MRDVSEYHMDSFVLFTQKIDGLGNVIRMVGGWSGGFAQGDSWRVSSPIVAVDTEEQYFLSETGNRYYYTGVERISMSFMGVLTQIQNSVKHFSYISLEDAIERVQDGKAIQ